MAATRSILRDAFSQLPLFYCTVTYLSAHHHHHHHHQLLVLLVEHRASTSTLHVTRFLANDPALAQGAASSCSWGGSKAFLATLLLFLKKLVVMGSGG